MKVNRLHRLLSSLLKVILLLICSNFVISCTYPILIKYESAGESISENIQGSDSDNNQTTNPDLNVEDQEGEPLCDGPERISVLVLGIDAHAQADAIRMVSVDFISGKVNVLAIPRDFYVEIVGFEDNRIYQGRINATFGYGEKYWGLGSGVTSVAENLAHNFGVEFDRHVVLDFEDVADYIDEIGGVDIDLEQAEADDQYYFSSGWHHFDGETAVNFMRMRHFDDDFHRINRQTLLLKVFYSKVMDELTPIQLVELALKGLADPSIKTNFVAADIFPLICLAGMIESEDVNFVEIPKEMYHSATTSSGGAVQIPHETVPSFIQSVMDGSY